ncbi:MAG: CHAT domain-containing protein [Phormidesmis sp.]
MGADDAVKTILVLAANPLGTAPLKLDREVRDIAEGLKMSQRRDLFQLEQRWAVRPRDIQRALLDVSPHIIHFSGHGSGEDGLIFEDGEGNGKLVSGEALAALFELFAETVECVLLNGCYSEIQANAIAQHIPSVIGMSQAVSDRAAIEFAVGFYDALGAGRSVDFAYKLGCSAIRLAGSADHLLPVLIQSAQLSEGLASEGLASEGLASGAASPPSPLPSPPPSATNSTPSNAPAPSKLTDGARRRLEIEQREVQNQLDALNEEIDFLQQSEKTEDLSPKERLLIQRQISAAKAKREPLNEQMTTMELQLQ